MPEYGENFQAYHYILAITWFQVSVSVVKYKLQWKLRYCSFGSSRWIERFLLHIHLYEKMSYFLFQKETEISRLGEQLKEAKSNQLKTLKDQLRKCMKNTSLGCPNIWMIFVSNRNNFLKKLVQGSRSFQNSRIRPLKRLRPCKSKYAPKFCFSVHNWKWKYQ